MELYIFFYTPFDAFFNSLQRRGAKVLGSKNDQFKRYFNFNIVKLIVRVTRRRYIANKRKNDPSTFIALCRELKDASNWV